MPAAIFSLTYSACVYAGLALGYSDGFLRSRNWQKYAEDAEPGAEAKGLYFVANTQVCSYH